MPPTHTATHTATVELTESYLPLIEARIARTLPADDFEDLAA